MTSDADRIRLLLDRDELTCMVHELAHLVDTKAFAGLSNLYAQDAVLVTPAGTIAGIDGIIAAARDNHAGLAQTQHLVAGTAIDLDGDKATMTANIVAAFVPIADNPAANHLTGVRYIFAANRGPEGWRFIEHTIVPIWDRECPVAPDEHAAARM